jgi:nicotinamide mononucleotide transporter
MFHAAIDWWTVLGTTPLEITATLCSVAGVILIARQRQLGWMLGIVWAVISAWLAWTKWQLVSDAILYASYVPIQFYCWMTWHRAMGQAAQRPSYLTPKIRLILCMGILLAVGAWGLGITKLAATYAWIPAPSLLWRDSASTVLNYFAQFLQAKKRMENWWLWILVNLLGIHIYWVKGVPIYSLQYGIFLILGIYGLFAWQRAVNTEETST